MLFSAFFLFLQASAPVNDWVPHNTVGVEAALHEVERLCEQHAKTEVLLQYDEPGYVDFDLKGCPGACQQRLLRGDYEFIEVELSVSEAEKLSKSARRRGLVDEPGKYRFSAQLAGHPSCERFEKERERANARRAARHGQGDGSRCVGIQKVQGFKSRFGVQRLRYDNSDLVESQDHRFIAQKSELQIIRLATGRVEARRSSLNLRFAPQDESQDEPLGVISCGGLVGSGNFIDHVLKGKELDDVRSNFRGGVILIR